MSGASTEPCRGRRIPGLPGVQKRRCEVNSYTRLGRPASLKVGSRAGPGAVPGLVVDVYAVRRAQCVDKVVAVPVVQVVAGLCSLLFDKVVDMPEFDRLQYVDKVVDFPACRSCSFSRCPS